MGLNVGATKDTLEKRPDTHLAKSDRVVNASERLGAAGRRQYERRGVLPDCIT